MAKKYYCCTPQIVKVTKGWKESISMPTFFLDPDIQGIVDTEHAEQIVRNMFRMFPDVVEVHPNVFLTE